MMSQNDEAGGAGSSRAGQDKVDPFAPIREPLLQAALQEAVFTGFTPGLVKTAANLSEIDEAGAKAAFPDGVASILRYWSFQADAAAVDILTTEEAASWRIREKVTFCLEARLDYLAPHKEASRRAAATLALPLYAGLGARLLWKTADTVWRGLGDPSTDFNFYSKRAILSGVWGTTFTRWLADDDPEYAATRAFLADRIENVMAFEKVKAQWRKTAPDPSRIFEFLARARYPSGRR